MNDPLSLVSTLDKLDDGAGGNHVTVAVFGCTCEACTLLIESSARPDRDLVREALRQVALRVLSVQGR